LLRSSVALILFFACFLASSLASERGLDALFLAGLQVKGVALDLLDNIFLLHLPLETAQSVLEGFALLKSHFCQLTHPQTRPVGPNSYYKELAASQGEELEICGEFVGSEWEWIILRRRIDF
jgi:hypothetical protein